MVDGKVAAETMRLVEEARGSTTLSFDPNCRPRLVHDKSEYIERMNQFARRAGIVRLSDSDFAFLYGGYAYAKQAEALFASDTSLFIVTRGVRGAQAWHKRAGAIDVETTPVEVVDTIGAGDSFQAALLFALRAMGRIAFGSSPECLRSRSGTSGNRPVSLRAARLESNRSIIILPDLS